MFSEEERHYLQELVAPLQLQLGQLAQLNAMIRADVAASHHIAERAEAQTEDVWSSMEAGLTDTNLRITTLDAQLTTVHTEMLSGFDRVNTDDQVLRSTIDAMRSTLEVAQAGIWVAGESVVASNKEIAALRLDNANEFGKTRAEIGQLAADLLDLRLEMRRGATETSLFLSHLSTDVAILRGFVENQETRFTNEFRAVHAKFDAANQQADERFAEHSYAIELLRSDVTQLKTDVAQLKTDVAELKTDVAQLKADVAELKTDVAQLKTDVAQLKTDVAELKVGQARIEEAMVALTVHVTTAFTVLTQRIDQLAA